MDSKPTSFNIRSYVKDRYPEFYSFIVIYFNQDYDLMFGKTMHDVISSYLRDEKKEAVIECLKEMDDYIIWANDMNLSDRQFRMAFAQSYSYTNEFRNSTEWVKYLSYLMNKLYKG